MNAITTHDLSKRFGTFTAVDAVNISVGEGKRYALIGPNGAGKTTRFVSFGTPLDDSYVEFVARSNSSSTTPPVGELISTFPSAITFSDSLTISVTDALDTFSNT